MDYGSPDKEIEEDLAQYRLGGPKIYDTATTRLAELNEQSAGMKSYIGNLKDEIYGIGNEKRGSVQSAKDKDDFELERKVQELGLADQFPEHRDMFERALNYEK